MMMLVLGLSESSEFKRAVGEELDNIICMSEHDVNNKRLKND